MSIFDTAPILITPPASIPDACAPALGPATSSITSVATSPHTRLLLPSNAARRSFTVTNNSEQVLYLALAARSSLNRNTVPLLPGATYFDNTGWTGPVSAVLPGGTGEASVTELRT